MNMARTMTRHEAWRVTLWALVGALLGGFLLVGVTQLAGMVGSNGLARTLVAVLALLIAVAFLIALLVALYDIYAVVRGPARDRTT